MGLCLSHCPGTWGGSREMTEIQVLSCKSLKGLRVVWPMKVHFRKLLTLLRAVQLFVMCSFLLGYFQLESGKWSWSLAESNDLLTPWMGHRERQTASQSIGGWACLLFKILWLWGASDGVGTWNPFEPLCRQTESGPVLSYPFRSTSVSQSHLQIKGKPILWSLGGHLSEQN